MEWSERDAPEPLREPGARGALPPPPRRPPTAVGAAAYEPGPEPDDPHRASRTPDPAARIAGADDPNAPPWLRALGQRFDEWLRTHEHGSRSAEGMARADGTPDTRRDRAA